MSTPIHTELNFETLLPRSELTLSAEVLEGTADNFYNDKTICITGAGGSIGTEIIRQILATCRPEKLVLIDHSEYNLFAVTERISGLLRAQSIDTEVRSYLDNLARPARLRTILQKENVEVIFHTAAYKHVPLLESNLIYAAENNILGTYNLINSASSVPDMKLFVNVSSDKASEPISVMGFTKRINERLIDCLGPDLGFRSCSVRFGNILGSSGSVIPIFLEQIKAGRMLTITHTDVVRYFMTAREAALFVLNAGTLAGRGELFVLDIGRPVKIVDLAEKVIAQIAAQNPGWQVPQPSYKVIGLRPGEKLREEPILCGREQPTSIDGIYQLPPEKDSVRFAEHFLAFVQTWEKASEPALLAGLESLALSGHMDGRSNPPRPNAMSAPISPKIVSDNDSNFLPFARPDTGAEEGEAVSKVLQSGWLTGGPQVREFESSFAELIGLPNAAQALAVSSATAALHLALVDAGVDQGHFVILPSFTFAATAEVVLYQKALPIFADVDKSGCLTADTIRTALDRARTLYPKHGLPAPGPDSVKAVMPVHYAGLSAELDPIIDLCSHNGWSLVEDAAHAFPTRYKDRFVGVPAEAGIGSYVLF